MEQNQKGSQGQLGLLALIAMIIGSTIGSGIFTITGDMAAGGAYTGAIIIGWAICGVGIFCLLKCFYGLNNDRPDLTNGVFSYAREGFGEYVGFLSAYGYWISALFTNVSYMALLFTTLNYFIPVFGNGSNLLATVCGSAIVWFAALLMLRGVKEATLVNIFTTLAKLIPIFVFIIAVLVVKAFDPAIFMDNFWGEGTNVSLVNQIRGTTMSTIWSFIGIEAAVVLSGRAKKSSDVGKAAFIGFFGIFAIYVMTAMLSLGVVPHDTLATLENPQMSGILETAVGAWGAILVRIGIILSICGAILGWTILACEAPYQASEQGVFMKAFSKVNKHGAPIFSTIVTTLIIQFFIIVSYFSESAYLLFYNLCVSMIMLPYLLSAAFYFKCGLKNKGLGENGGYGTAKVFGLLGTVYGLWMIYGGGLSYFLVTTVLYTPGILIYHFSKKEKGLPTFDHKYELGLAVVIGILGVISLFMLVTGRIVL